MAAYPKLTLSMISTTSVRFEVATSSWEGDVFYVFYRIASDESDSNWKEVSGCSYGETFSITDLESGTKYAFRVSEQKNFSGEYGDGTLSNKTVSSVAFDCGYFTTDEDSGVDGYEYTFCNESDYDIYLSFSLSTSSVRSIVIPSGEERYLVCEPDTIKFDVSNCEVNGESDTFDYIYWQRTEPTKGTKYQLNSDDGNELSLRSSSDATYTFTVDGYSTGGDEEYSYSYYIYACVDNNDPVLLYYDDDFTSSDNPETVNVKPYTQSADYSSYNYEGFTKTLSGTPDDSTYTVELQEGVQNNIYLWFKTPVLYEYSYRIYAIIDNGTASLIGEDEFPSYNDKETLDLSVYYNSSDYDNYNYLGFSYSRAGTPDDSTDEAVLKDGQVLNIYLWFETPKYKVKFICYYDDSKLGTYYSDDAYPVGCTVTIKEIAPDLSEMNYSYQYATDSNDNIITELTIQAKVSTVYAFYVLNEITVTINHYRGKRKYGSSSTVNVPSGTIVDGADTDYHRSDIPCCIYAKGDKIIAAENATSINIYYKYVWDNPPQTGSPWYITASEWNYLRDFIDDQRLAVGNAKSGLADVISNETFTFTHYNNMWGAIGKGTKVQRWQEITQALMDELVTNANAMAGL